MRAPLLAILAATGALSACQSQSSTPAAGAGKSAALRNMEQVATAAYRCWFESGDAVFADYSFANELNSFSGRPRFLLVPEDDFGGRPLLVVEAADPEGEVSAFGPLMQSRHGPRIAGDVSRWAGGDSGCESAA